MDKIKINYSNLSRLKEVLKKYVLDKVGSRKFTGYASIDKPWEKGILFTPKHIEIPDIPYAALVMNRPDFNATDDMLACHEARISKDMLQIKAYCMAKALKAKGIKKGDKVCLSTNESIEATIVEAACSLIGAVSVNLPSNSSVEGLKNFLEEFECKYYFVSDQYRKIAEAATIDMNNLNMCILPTDTSFKNIKDLSSETIEWLDKCRDDRPLTEKEDSYADMLRLGVSSKFDKVIERLDVNDPAKILFTSGTSGKPKPICLSNGNINAELIRLKNQTHMNLGVKGICLKVVADMYPYGNIICKWFPMFVGKCVGLTPTLTPMNAYYYLKMYLPKYIQAIPSFFRNLRNDPRIKDIIKCVKYAVSGGEKYETHDKIEDNAYFKENGSTAVILDGSGVSEAVACATTAVGSAYNVKSVGRPMVGVNIKIIEDDETKPFSEAKEKMYNENGLICYSGDTLMLGYYNQPEKTESTMFYDEYGQKWFVSDAIGHIDPKGYLYIVARKARCFTAYDENGSAFKLSPEEVESIMIQHPLVDEVVALPMQVEMANGIKNNAVKVYVKSKKDLTEQDLNDLLGYCEGSELARCSVPRKIEQWVGEWPLLNGHGSKIDYKEIQKISDEEEAKILENGRVL